MIEVGDWLAIRQAALRGRVPAGVRKILESQRAREQLLHATLTGNRLVLALRLRELGAKVERVEERRTK